MYTHLIRLSMLLKSLNEACGLIQNAPNFKLDNITTEFEEACTQIINNLPTKAFIIEPTIVTQAIDLLNYLQMHKLIFSQYQVDISFDFETNIEIMIKENFDKIKLSGPYISENIYMEKIYKRISYYPTQSPFSNDISDGNGLVADIERAFQKLQLHKLGLVEIKKARNFKLFSVFHRVSLDLIKSTKSLGNAIQCLAINLNHYIQHLTAAEINQRANKRTRESPELTNSPKAKKAKANNKVTITGQKYGLPIQLDLDKYSMSQLKKHKANRTGTATSVGYEPLDIHNL